MDPCVAEGTGAVSALPDASSFALRLVEGHAVGCAAPPPPMNTVTTPLLEIARRRDDPTTPAAAATWGGVDGPGEVEQVHPVCLVELQGTCDAVEDIFGNAAHVPAL